MEYVTLNNGVKMPKLGYGVYQTPPAETERCVREAIEVGSPYKRVAPPLKGVGRLLFVRRKIQNRA